MNQPPTTPGSAQPAMTKQESTELIGLHLLPERMRRRVERLVACGTPIVTAQLAVHAMNNLPACSDEWVTFANPEDDPPTLQLFHPPTGATIEFSHLPPETTP
jgi:hypothetical protein